MTSDGKLLVTDRTSCTVTICNRDTGVMLSQVCGISTNDGDIVNFKEPHGVAVDGTDKIMVTDTALNSVFMF